METMTFGEIVQGLLYWAIFLYFYLLPTTIALQKGSSMTGAILFLNLFFGWTVIVWIICFIWACVTE